MSRHRANLLLLVAGALWGMGFVAQSTAMEAVGPLLFIGLRFLAATLSMAPFALREAGHAKQALSASEWRGFGLIGMLLFAGMTAQQVGLMTTSVTNSGFLTGLYVVMVPIFGLALFGQRPHAVVWLGSALALAGIWLLSGASAAPLTTGDWLTILCAAFWALQVIMITRQAAGTGRPVTLAVTQFAVCSALALAGAILLEEIAWAAIKEALPQILYTGIFSGGIAFTLQAVGQRYTTPSQAAIFLSSEAIFAALFGAILLGERIAALGLAGCALILCAMLAVEVIPAWQAGRKTAGLR